MAVLPFINSFPQRLKPNFDGAPEALQLYQ